jgi:hypothetical protein
MRFLADESCDFSVVRALRSADHDVVAIAEVSPREEDDAVMNERLERSLPVTVVEVVRRRGQHLIGSFTVLQPGRVRTGPRPRGR